MKLLCRLGFFLVVWSIPSFAWESLPEYSSLDETEQELFETPDRLEPEYQSDILAFTKPFEWEYLWLTHDQALDLSVGSVSARHFMMDNRLKIRTFLNDSLEFRFYYFNESNLERESNHAILELSYWMLNKKLAFSFYGEPALYKRNNDTGLAFTLKLQDRHEIRLFNTFVDTTRLKRNDRTDTYLKPNEPASRGLVGRIWSKKKSDGTGDFLEYSFRYEPKTRWLFRDDNYEYQYWKFFSSIFGSKLLSEQVRLNIRVQFDRKFETRIPKNDVAVIERVNSEAILTDRKLFVIQTVFPRLGPHQNWNLLSGIQFTHRKWTMNRGGVIHQNLLPHLTLSMPAFRRGASQDFWSVGYDFSWHRGHGIRSLRNALDDDVQLNQRLNLAYDFILGQKSVLKLLASADLDEFGTARSWEGGNAQFRLHF